MLIVLDDRRTMRGAAATARVAGRAGAENGRGPPEK